MWVWVNYTCIFMYARGRVCILIPRRLWLWCDFRPVTQSFHVFNLVRPFVSGESLQLATLRRKTSTPSRGHADHEFDLPFPW